MQYTLGRCLMAVVLLGVTACSPVEWGIRKEAPTESGVWRDHYRTKRFSEDDFMMELIRFTDNRIPRESAKDHRQDVLYEYDPDELMSGVKYRIPVLFDKHFNLTHVQEPVFRVEIELRKMRTAIRTGHIMSGPFGKYDIVMDIDYIVRHPDSSILVRDSEEIHLDRKRESDIGRAPAVKLDQQRMYDLTEAAIQKLAQKMIWKTRRMYHAEQRQKTIDTYKKEEKEYGVEELGN